MAQEYKFVFTANEAYTAGVSEPKKLPMLIRKAMSLARAPISRMKVGAVGRASSGRVYLGVNVDFPGLPLHHSIHAEQFLVTNLALNSERGLRQLAVASSIDGLDFLSPCGHCLQFLLEIRNAPDIEILIRTKHLGPYFCRLGSRLPDRFAADDVLPKGFPLLLEEHDNFLSLPDPERFPPPEICKDCSHLKCRALAAANKSFAPYTDSPSGVALLDDDGNMYSGWYIESVACNPSLGPVQAAVVDFVARSRGKEFDKIVGAVLVEKNNARVSQERTAKMILETIAHPDCDFKVFHCNEDFAKKLLVTYGTMSMTDKNDN